MISIVLIGDKANAARFLNGLKRKSGHPTQYLINDGAVEIKYQPDVAKAVKTKFSGVIVANTNDNHIPLSVADHLNRFPIQGVYYHSPVEQKPGNELEKFVAKLKPVETLQNKLKFFLFGEKPTCGNSRHLKMEIGRRKTIA